MNSALDHMKDKYGYKQGATPTEQPQSHEKKRKHSTAGLSAHKLQDQQRYMRVSSLTAPPVKAAPHPASTHSPAKKKTRLKDDVRAAPAVRQENQKLVDGLVGLGEYELKTGRSQRGVTRLRAAKQIRDSNDVIKSGAQARHLDGIGASAAEKVDVLLRGGLRSAMKEYEKDDNAEEEDGGEEEEEEVSEVTASEDEVEDAARQQETARKLQGAKLGATKLRARKSGKEGEEPTTHGDDRDDGGGDVDDEFFSAEE